MPKGVYPRSPELRARLAAQARETHQKRWASLTDEERREVIEKMVAPVRGKPQSEEHKAKRVEAFKQAVASGALDDFYQRQRENAVGHSFKDGYRILSGQQGHPLADGGRLEEHRKVLYDKIGPGPHPCHWGCGKTLEWGGKSGIQADHLDGDRLNNDPDNLVASCGGCNVKRAMAGNPQSWTP